MSCSEEAAQRGVFQRRDEALERAARTGGKVSTVQLSR